MHRVSTALCPACDGANAASARYCSQCGTVLIMRCPACDAVNARTRERCHQCAAALHAAGPAADEGPIVPMLVPAGIEPVTLDWRLDLREPVTATAGWPGLPEPDQDAAGHEVDAPPSQSADLPLIGDPDAPRQPPPAAQTGAVPARPSLADLAGAKAQRRAAVRRSQLRRRAVGTAPPPIDVLVLEADPDARVQLCSLLEVFGFRPHVAVSVAEAEGLSVRRTHVAAFLGLGEDAATTAEFCRRLHATPRGRPSAVIAISDRDRHADRVRLQLAGADQTIFRPLARGDVARALDACGLRLPRDPRQGTAPDR